MLELRFLSLPFQHVIRTTTAGWCTEFLASTCVPSTLGLDKGTASFQGGVYHIIIMRREVDRIQDWISVLEGCSLAKLIPNRDQLLNMYVYQAATHTLGCLSVVTLYHNYVNDAE